MNRRVVAFDADDTLWVNEPYYQETEKKFCELLEDFMPRHAVSQELFKTEIQNLPLYGYGSKSFMLSMIETAIYLSQNTVGTEVIGKILSIGKELITRKIELLEGVDEALRALSGKFKLVLATKGDLLDQERKLKNSGIEHFFHHIEIMSDKKEEDYFKLIKHLDILPGEFIMVGNSLKSDIIPVLNLGGIAIHVPYHTTWEYEKIEIEIENQNFHKVSSIFEVTKILLNEQV